MFGGGVTNRSLRDAKLVLRTRLSNDEQSTRFAIEHKTFLPYADTLDLPRSASKTVCSN